MYAQLIAVNAAAGEMDHWGKSARLVWELMTVRESVFVPIQAVIQCFIVCGHTLDLNNMRRHLK